MSMPLSLATRTLYSSSLTSEGAYESIEPGLSETEEAPHTSS